MTGVRHDELLHAIREAIVDSPDLPAAMWHTVRLLKDAVPHYNWVGIYLLDGNELVLGPFVGKPSPHTRIPVGRGVAMPAVMLMKSPGDYGLPARSFALVTKTVMIVVQMGFLGTPHAVPGFYVPIRDLRNVDPHLWVYDKATGEKLAEIELPSNAGGAPITYMAGGRQFIAFPVGGGPVPEELIAVGL